MSEQLTLKQRIHNSEIINIGGAPTSASKSELEAVLSQDSYDLIGTDAQHSAFNEEKARCILRQLGSVGDARSVTHQTHAERLSYWEYSRFGAIGNCRTAG